MSGRVLPNDVEAEGTVLTMAFEPGQFDELAIILRGEHFYANANRCIWEAMANLASKGRPIEPTSVAGVLRDRGQFEQIGGMPYLAVLVGGAYVVDAEVYAKRVIGKWRMRQVIAAAQTIAAEGYSSAEEPDEFIREAEARIYAVASSGARPTRSATVREIAKEAITEIDLKFNRQKAPGLSTGFVSLDRRIGWMNPGCVYVVAARPGMGKCLGKGTLVLKYNGETIPAEEVKVGDLLMGPDSRPRRVRSTASGAGPLFRVVPKKGDAWVCNWCHVLTLKHSETGSVVDLPLDEYIRKTGKFKHHAKLFAVPVEFEPFEQPPPLDPYVIGLWLGDGTKSLKTFQVTKPDQEVEDALVAFAATHHMRASAYKSPSRCKTCKTVSVVGRKGKRSALLGTMRELFPKGLEIPARYKYGSRAERLQLLAGLLDSDGHLRFGGFEFVQKDRLLARDTAFVARSLGFKVTVSTKVVGGEPYERLGIIGDLSIVPNRIQRKKAPVRQQKKDPLRTGFKVEPIGDGDYFGFELDGDGRFLLGDFTVTHNTSLCTHVMKSVALSGGATNGVFFASVEMPKAQIMSRLLSQEAGIDTRAVNAGFINKQQWSELCDRANDIGSWPMIFDDTESIKVSELRGLIRRGARRIEREYKKHLGLVAIDYAQIMGKEQTRKNMSDDSLFSEISAGVLGIAKEFNVPVMLLAQLNRDCEKRPDKRPQLSDLRSSGAFEQDANSVIFIYRDDVYKKPGEQKDGIAELIVAKSRGGSPGTVSVGFVGRYAQFVDKQDDDPDDEFARMADEFGSFADNYEEDPRFS
jgi:replicative DNA helicase